MRKSIRTLDQLVQYTDATYLAFAEATNFLLRCCLSLLELYPSAYLFTQTLVRHAEHLRYIIHNGQRG